MGIYENNLRELESKHKDIYEIISDKDFVCNTEMVFVEDARNGEKIIGCRVDNKEYFFNSKYNPQNEAQKYIEDEISIPDESVITMYGLSNGCFAREFLSKNKNNVRCIVFEPDLAVFIQVIRNIDITDILSDARLFLVVNDINLDMMEIILEKSLREFNKNNNRHIALPKYADIYNDTYDWMVKIIDEKYDRMKILTNTAIQFGKRCCKNDIYNMKYLAGCRSGNDLVGMFPDDMPAIVVSAGPSLAKNVNLLREAKGKALIVVVDAAINTVVSVGIMPDMIVSIDFAKPLENFKAEGLQKVPFIANMDSNSKVFDYLKPENLFFGSSDSLVWDKLFKKVGSEIRMLEEGGSVATAAIANLISWGFKKIILIGQDLAFTGNRMHVGDTKAKFTFDDKGYTYVKGLDGEDIPVRKDYLQYLRWIENIGYKYKDLEIIDATEGGSLKRNTTVMTFRDALDRYCVKEYDVEKIIYETPRLFEGKDISIVAKMLFCMKNNLRNIAGELSRASADCRRASIMLSRGENNIRELKRINASIDKLDNKLLNMDEVNLINKYVSDAEVDFITDMYIEEENHIKESIRMYDKCTSYYHKLAVTIPEIIDIIEDCLKDIVVY